MSETLVIRLPAQHSAAPAQWLLMEAADTRHNGRVGAVLQGSLSEAAALAPGRRVLALAPGVETVQLEPVLPPLKGNAKLSQVVPYALEDQLSSDVDALHFAVGKRGERPGTPVTVVSHDAMQRWIFALREVGVQADALYADTSLAPVVHGGYSLLIDAGRVSARQGDAPVTTLDVEPLAEALNLLLPATDAPVTIYVAESEYDAQQMVIEGVRERAPATQIKLLPDGALPLLATQALHNVGINLLQGIYTPRTRLSGNFKGWRYAAAALLGWLAVHLLTSGTELYRLNKQETALDQQLSITYGQGLPGAGPVEPDKARQTFESRLQQAQARSASNGLMLGLGALADAMRNSGSLQLDAINYRNDNVDLRILAPDVQALEQIRQQAQSHGMTAEIQSANPKDNQIEGRLVMKSSGAAT